MPPVSRLMPYFLFLAKKNIPFYKRRKSGIIDELVCFFTRFSRFVLLHRSLAVFVAASTSCFPELSLRDALDRLADLEYTSAEIVVAEQYGEHPGQLLPSELVENFDSLVHACRLSRRISPVAFFYNVESDHEKHIEWFTALCQLAKALRVISISVLPAKIGTPFNEEVNRLQTLVRVGTREGVHVGLLTKSESLTENPETLGSLCKTVQGLTVCLDPSYYIYGCAKPKDYDMLTEYVSHVRLRDTTKDAFQVQIGQGVIEYGRLVIQLGKVGYRRALCADLDILPNVDPVAELRKMRLLLESLL